MCAATHWLPILDALERVFAIAEGGPAGRSTETELADCRQRSPTESGRTACYELLKTIRFSPHQGARSPSLRFVAAVFTFDDVVAAVRGRLEPFTVLLGNGFSMDWHPFAFAYTSSSSPALDQLYVAKPESRGRMVNQARVTILDASSAHARLRK